jgi:hypothetical protein
LHTAKLGDFVDRIYSIELEIRDITDTALAVPYLDQSLEGAVVVVIAW